MAITKAISPDSSTIGADAMTQGVKPESAPITVKDSPKLVVTRAPQTNFICELGSAKKDGTALRVIPRIKLPIKPDNAA
jgi:hypothetical protein